jgi:hypothetical protein
MTIAAVIGVLRIWHSTLRRVSTWEYDYHETTLGIITPDAGGQRQHDGWWW